MHHKEIHTCKITIIHSNNMENYIADSVDDEIKFGREKRHQHYVSRNTIRKQKSDIDNYTSNMN